MKNKKLIIVLIFMMLFCLMPKNEVFAATKTSNLEMVMKSGSYSYSTKSTSSKSKKP